MMSLRHGWGWQPPQTVSLRRIQSVWAHWYAVHGHMAVASTSYTNSTWFIFGGSGSLVESKWCHYIMVNVYSPLKLLPASILDIFKVFEHIDILFWGNRQQPQTVIPTLLLSGFGVLNLKMMSLHHGLGWQPTQTASCIHIIHIQSVWAYWYAVHGHMVVASSSYTHPTWLIPGGSGSLVESKWCHYVMVEADSHFEVLPISKLYI